MKTHTILIAEDDSDDEFLLRSVFSEMELAVKLDFVKDGQELLDYLSENETLPSLVFLDLNMPKIGGREVLERMKKSESLNHLPVIIFSTSAAPDEIRKAYVSGASAYITKPASYDKLKYLIQRLSEFYFELATLPGQ
jgi:CheY-like chemotaxis protein